MAKLKFCIFMAFFILLLTMEATIAQGEEKKPKKPKKHDDDETNYKELSPLPSGQERAFCQAQGSCYYKTLVCPSECPQRKPKKNKKQKGCFVDCTSKCEATCKYRRANCNGYGSLCYDPRFVGGDGVMFYFHGAKGGNFAIVSDDNLHINAHFIGTRPQGRTRDFTWVQALSVMFDTHTLVIAANRVSHWNDNVDSLIVKWDGEAISIPTDEEAEWRVNTEEREVVVERTDEANSVRVKVSGLVEMDIKVRPIGEEENRVHKYQLPADDAFAHLETQFRFKNLSDEVEGVLGKTYRPHYVSPVKRGVPMPMMGGEDKYRTSSLLSPSCNFCRFQRPSGFAADEGIAQY
ncbi:Root_cap domain-containing protein [Senna tora]|uniref:Root_cap domain-containing protein n=1 Tax=Senna tora TaxID=362788 RepID=A0A834SKV3_9FABA|nr:Root_cap domain-containing protein [Senna tora]